jgi:hypothetical protein
MLPPCSNYIIILLAFFLACSLFFTLVAQLPGGTYSLFSSCVSQLNLLCIVFYFLLPSLHTSQGLFLTRKTFTL